MVVERVFNIGIALAGGSTRGAYSAGVMDYLFQALNEWDALRASPPQTSTPPLPPWFVRLKTLAGTSAGGITAAVATAAICTPHQPLTNAVAPPDPINNNLFDLWVNAVRLEKLFDTADLDPQASRAALAAGKHSPPVRSLLNSSFLETEAQTALNAISTDLERPAWADGLELYVTTSNLRGVPYELQNFRGGEKGLSDFHMTLHRDWVGFKTGDCSRKGLFALDLNSPRDSPQWEHVKVAAQATATLPVVFPLKRVSVPLSLYEGKTFWGTPSWPKGMEPEFHYDAVDGGVFRNEPMGLVHMAMEHDQKTEVLTENGENARGAMILLHPSPSYSGYNPKYSHLGGNLIRVLMDMVNALMNEANFHEKELEEIRSESNISRFMISPSREGRRQGEEILGTDTFAGFGGIIGKSIRLHDFQLGRRNCQRFLAEHFVVPLELAKKNPIFGEEAASFAVKNDAGDLVVPIIPLVGGAAEECPRPVWPRFTKEQRVQVEKKIISTIRKRLSTVFECIAVNLGFYRTTFRFGIYKMWNFVVGRLVNMAADRAMDLVTPRTEIALNNFDVVQ